MLYWNTTLEASPEKLLYKLHTLSTQLCVAFSGLKLGFGAGFLVPEDAIDRQDRLTVSEDVHQEKHHDRCDM